MSGTKNLLNEHTYTVYPKIDMSKLLCECSSKYNVKMFNISLK